MHAPMMRALLLPLLLAGATPPPIEWAAKGDNVYARAAWKHDNPANHVVYLGTLASADACAADANASADASADASAPPRPA